MKTLKKFHEMGRGGYEKLPRSNGVEFRWMMLPEFASEVLSSNALCWVKISNGMEFLNFLLFIEIFYPLSIIIYHF